MLPVSRVIGHKEYGNQGPPVGNGSKGRKQDPVYSMDWRRQRVAAFKPRGSAPDTPEDDMFSDDDRALLRRLDAKLSDPVINGGTLPHAVRQLHAGLVTKKYDRPGPSIDGGDLDPVSALSLIRYGEANIRRLLVEQAALRAACEALAARDGIDADELRGIVQDAVKDAVVQVDVTVTDGDLPDEKPAA